VNCPKCGRENPPQAQFCVFCGAMLAGAPAAGTPPAPSAPPAAPSPPPAYAAGPSPGAYPTAHPMAAPAYVPPPPFPLFLMEMPSPWRERYATAHSLIRTGDLLRILGLVLGGGLSVLLLIPILYLASQVGGQWGGVIFWLVIATLIWGGVIALGLFALGTLVRASGYQLAALLNLEVRSAPEESLPAEQKDRILRAAAFLGQA